jgi:hypothetical protein
MFTSHSRRFAAALTVLTALAAPALAAPAGKPVAGQQVRFPNGTWSALPQVGPDGRVRQCVMVALRQRSGSNGPVDTRFSINISRGSGLTIMMQDDGLPSEQVLDDQVEVMIEGRAFAAVFFPIGTALVFHPGDAEAALTAFGKAKELKLRSDGGGIDSGAIKIDLPSEALSWLKQCGKTFNIAIDKPTDRDAPAMPTPRPRSPKIAFIPATPAGPPGMADKQKIEGWDASELRNNDGSVIVCIIRQHYFVTSSEPERRQLATFFMASRAKGLTMMLKDSIRHGNEGDAVEASLDMDGKPFPPFAAAVLGPDEVGIEPQHGADLAAALESGGRGTFKTGTDYKLEFPIQPGVIPWLRACPGATAFRSSAPANNSRNRGGHLGTRRRPQLDSLAAAF